MSLRRAGGFAAQYRVDHDGYRHYRDAHHKLEQDAGGEPVRVPRRSGEVVVTDDGLFQHSPIAPAVQATRNKVPTAAAVARSVITVPFPR